MVDRQEDLIQDLKGHSGCRVQLIRSGERYFVRKTSASVAYNDRLLGQIDKQQRLAKLIPLAKVLSVETGSTLVHFDMEYLPGRDFATQCIMEPVGWIISLAEQLLDVLHVLSSVSLGGLSRETILTKIDEIDDRLRDRPGAEPVCSVLNDALQYLRTADWNNVPCTACHGDLTFENILFKEDGSLAFIDALDGSLETFWLDAAKLLFDLEIGWTLRTVLWQPNGADQSGRLLDILSRYLRQEIETRVADRYPALFARLPQLKMVQALRVLPYARDDETRDRLIAYVNSNDPSQRSLA